MTAPAVPMTAGEQKWTERELWLMAEAMDNASSYHEGMRRPARESVLAWLNDGISDSGHVVADQLFTEAPPAPQPVSGQLTGLDLLRELNNHGIYVTHSGDSYLTDKAYAALDRAGARLAVPQGATGKDSLQVAAGREVVPFVVEATAADYASARCAEASARKKGANNLACDIAGAMEMTRCLRARAGTAGPTWVTRPEAQAGAFKTPAECGVTEGTVFVVLDGGGKGARYYTDMDGVVRWSADGITWHARTATAGGWTADTVPQVGEAGVLYRADGTVIDDGSVVFVKGGAELAELWNRQHTEVAAYVKVPATIPPVEAQP